MSKTLIFGRGWLGTQFASKIEGAELVAIDIANEQDVGATLDSTKPNRVLNCAGATGSPNVDSCESDPERTYRSNVTGPLVLASACKTRGIHFTHLGSGCVYSGDNGGKGYAEDDPPNFHGSLYSRTKALSEAALRDLGALQLRVRMPISSIPHPRNLLTKLLQFSHVTNVPNSVTVLEDLWVPAIELMNRSETGVWNMVNEGAEVHDGVLRLVQELINPSHTFDVIDANELASLTVAPRSNCILSTDKLKRAGLTMPHVEQRLPLLVTAYGKNLGSAKC